MAYQAKRASKKSSGSGLKIALIVCFILLLAALGTLLWLILQERNSHGGSHDTADRPGSSFEVETDTGSHTEPDKEPQVSAPDYSAELAQAEALEAAGDPAAALSMITALPGWEQDSGLSALAARCEAALSAREALLAEADALEAAGDYAAVLELIREQPDWENDELLSTRAARCETALEELSAVLAKADKLAASYDYRGASALLETLENHETSTVIRDRLAYYAEEDSKLVVYKDMSSITHIFFHSLIVEPSRAFDGDSRQTGYNQYMTTVSEFIAILESMYERGYVLVSPHQVAGEVEQPDGTTRFEYLEIRLPAGKKPFMLSEDDVAYYGDMICGITGMNETPRFATTAGDGFASRMVIGEDGYVTCEYMDINGNVTYGDYDVVPILEHFCQEHPDFSYHGARGIIAPTAYEGVFGYRTKPSYEAALGSERYQQECDDARAVAQALRDQGWDLASHSYGHPGMGSATVEKVRSDTEKFHNTAESIIGEVDIFIYPHGDDIAGVEKYTMSNEKFAILWNDGFRYFFNVDNCVAWHQMGEHYFRGNRRDLDGFRMYNYPDSMNDLIDARAILDPARPLPVPMI